MARSLTEPVRNRKSRSMKWSGLKHRLMLRNQDILFKENLDPLVREKLLHALASVASQACFALS